MAAVDIDRFGRDAAQRQQILDEQVLFQDHLFAGVAALSGEEGTRDLWPLVPCPERADDPLHVNDRLDPIVVTSRPVEAES